MVNDLDDIGGKLEECIRGLERVSAFNFDDRIDSVVDELNNTQSSFEELVDDLEEVLER